MTTQSNEAPVGSAAGAPDRGEVAEAVAGEGLFVRKSSGLVREMGLRDAFSVGVAWTNFSGLAVTFVILLSLFPGVSITWALLITGILSFATAIAYAELVAAMPRSGGDYVYLSRIFHPAVGAAVGGAVLVGIALTVGQAALANVQLQVAFMLEGVGHALGIHWIAALANHVSTKAALFLISTGAILLAAVVSVRGAHTVGKVLFWSWAFAALAAVIYVVECLAHGNGAFVSAFDTRAHNPHAYQQVIAAARAAGIQKQSGSIGQALPLAFLTWTGYSFASYSAGELKRPDRTFKRTAPAALGVAIVVFVVGWLALQHMAGHDFLRSAAFLSAHDSASYTKITGGLPTAQSYYTYIVTGDPITKIILSMAFVIAYWAILPAAIMLFSRCVFAFSFDRVLPARLADIGQRSHGPTNAVLLATAAGIAFVALGVFVSGFLTLTRNLSLIFTAVFAIASLGAMLLPYRRPDLYGLSPKILRGSWLGLPPITVVGAISLVVNGVFLYFGATSTSVSGGFDSGSVITLVLTCTVGLLFYGISRIAMRRKGIDVSLAMRELPPE